MGYYFLLQCRKVKSENEVAQSCLTLSDPMDCSLLGSSVHGICQARVLEWGAIAFSDHKMLLFYVFKKFMYLFTFVCVGSSEKAMATHSSTLAWQIPWTEEPGRLQFMGSLGVGHD